MIELKEYYEGSPDNVTMYDDDSDYPLETLEWYDSDDTVTFGEFQVDLDGAFEFLTAKGQVTHMDLARTAAKMIVGKALNHIKDAQLEWLGLRCYDTSTLRGRVWLDHHVLALWDNDIGSDDVEKIFSRLKIDPRQYEIVFTEGRSVEAEEYIVKGIQSSSSPNRGFDVGNQLRQEIEKYNNANLSYSASKEREGWTAMAQRHNMLYQESKQRDMEKKNKRYQEEFSNYLEIMNEALKRDDFNAYGVVKEMLDEAIDSRKEDIELMSEMDTDNFGVLNHIFEEALPILFKTNRQAVKDVIKTIKGDKNLIREFHFYNLIRQYDSDAAKNLTPSEMLKRVDEMTAEKIDKKTILESNKKLRDVMLKSGVKPLKHLTEDDMKFYECGHNVLTLAENASNMLALASAHGEILKRLDENKTLVRKSSDTLDEAIGKFEDKMRENLTEGEISFVKQITDFRSPIAEKRKEKLYNKFKNECIAKIDEMLKEDSSNVDLQSLKKQLEEQAFNGATIVKDIAKMLEIRDILIDK